MSVPPVAPPPIPPRWKPDWALRILGGVLLLASTGLVSCQLLLG